MREAELWQRLAAHLGDGYAPVWADMHVLGALGGRTVNEALRAGYDYKVIWRAVWGELELPVQDR